MKELRTLALSLLVLASAPPSAAITAGIDPTTVTVPVEATFTISVQVHLGDSGKTLGSYGAVLTWDPGILQYQSDTGGGQPPFSSAVVNRNDVALGTLRFSAASPTGASGDVTIMNVTYALLVEPCDRTPLDLEFTSMASTGPTFENLLPLLTVVMDGSVLELRIELTVTGQTATILDWSTQPQALSYDVIRGLVSNLSMAGPILHLGPVICLEDDSQDTTTGAGTEAANPDMETPFPGETFFYLVRFFDGAGNTDYTFSSSCVEASIVDAGDCPTQGALF